MRITIAMIGLVLAVVPAAAQPAPTATEIFELRRRCQVLAEQILNDLTAGPYWHQTAVSNYDIKKNHCYVKIDASPSNLNLPLNETKYTTELYDGHTKQKLAVLRSEGGKKTYGEIFDEGYVGTPYGFDETSNYIQKLMITER